MINHSFFKSKEPGKRNCLLWLLNKKFESEEINTTVEESVTMYTCVLLIKHVSG